MRGISNFFAVLADVPFTSNVVPATVGLQIPIAASQRLKFRAWVKVSVGATGGVRAIVAVPAGGTLFSTSIKLYNTVAPSLTTAVQSASAAFTNALANAGTHWIEIEGVVINGTTTGVVDVQFAQNTSDPLTMTVLAGGSMETTLY